MSGTFAALFGREPEGTWSAPGRVNVIGEFTDYNDGFVLPTSLPMATRATVARREDGVVRVASSEHGTTSSAGAGAEGLTTSPRAMVARHAPGVEIVESRLDELRPRTVDSWAAYVFGVAWALREAGHEVGGLDILVESDVPTGAGLSSSAALECSVGLAFRAVFDLAITREELALLAQRGENEFVGVPSGIMDQMASLLCVPGSALLLDTRSLDYRQVPFALGPADLALMVLDTRVRHELGNSAYAERRRSCEIAARKLGVPALRDVEPTQLEAALARLDDAVLEKRTRHIVTEGARVLEVARLLDAGRPDAIGPILTAGHASLRDDFEVSCPELDLAVAAALDAGALGARMVGGGFGGSAIALVHTAGAPSVEQAVFTGFAQAGFAAPRVFVAAPAATKTRVPAEPPPTPPGAVEAARRPTIAG